VLLGAYAALSVVHLFTRLVESEVGALVTKALLMPVLAAYLLSATGRPLTRMVRVVLAALAFSWLGDMLLELTSVTGADALFLAGLGAFLVAQVLYVVAFAPVIRASTPPRPPFWALLYVPAVALLIGLLAPQVGALLVPVGVYAAAIATMAIVASGVNRWTAAGAFAFVVSDALLATVRWDVLELAGVVERLAVMSTYTLAQGLLVYGVVVAQRHIWHDRPEPAEA
jgi:uncharacterized membrane protein YhhN